MYSRGARGNQAGLWSWQLIVITCGPLYLHVHIVVVVDDHYHAYAHRRAQRVNHTTIAVCVLQPQSLSAYWSAWLRSVHLCVQSQARLQGLLHMGRCKLVGLQGVVGMRDLYIVLL